MIFKWIGAALVFFSCAFCGISVAASYRREEKMYCNLIHILSYMKNELQFRLISVPELCELAGEETEGCIRDTFLKLSMELQTWTSPDVQSCMRNVLKEDTNMPQRIRNVLLDIGNVLGRFDLNGQLDGFDMIKAECETALERFKDHRSERLRGYQSLGFCAGAALVIIFI